MTEVSVLKNGFSKLDYSESFERKDDIILSGEDIPLFNDDEDYNIMNSLIN